MPPRIPMSDELLREGPIGELDNLNKALLKLLRHVERRRVPQEAVAATTAPTGTAATSIALPTVVCASGSVSPPMQPIPPRPIGIHDARGDPQPQSFYQGNSISTTSTFSATPNYHASLRTPPIDLCGHPTTRPNYLPQHEHGWSASMPGGQLGAPHGLGVDITPPRMQPGAVSYPTDARRDYGLRATLQYSLNPVGKDERRGVDDVCCEHVLPEHRQSEEQLHQVDQRQRLEDKDRERLRRDEEARRWWDEQEERRRRDEEERRQWDDQEELWRRDEEERRRWDEQEERLRRDEEDRCWWDEQEERWRRDEEECCRWDEQDVRQREDGVRVRDTNAWTSGPASSEPEQVDRRALHDGYRPPADIPRVQYPNINDAHHNPWPDDRRSQEHFDPPHVQYSRVTDDEPELDPRSQQHFDQHRRYTQH
ncbi:hypothetical protein C8J57DRAFT_1502750 [Mycena rebaudengoi]|nr:hypothetical protein C8J57DRAFT_1502750 [Mycena rebaudengoi]